LQNSGLPGQHIRAAINETLILHQPGVPSAGMILGISHIDWAMAIWHRMCGIADVAVGGVLICSLWRVKR